ncbi:TldD family protein, Actinobacterial subgroup [Arcticibacter svalbardensis MN12-7]|uniref:TldD family protein, Actinobacterial subgroup n=1 Tax=Arcticibacter svalbardensis MN12-7 TaxID=1150600 RepID=R9GXA1_9SPHI|nr:TldD/PmbA family protein [Arcticibacter svalbardensis]EOR96120.1 TldD family protein, Actinobacterial subgroup [Arcticibacter svalbardensis MN12-7]
MKRRDFLYLTGVGVGASILESMPVFGKAITIEQALTPVDVKLKKRMADVALNAARSKGATYADVRIGRYLNQAIITREAQVQNIANTESYGLGVRVIANGSWGFAATDILTDDSIAKAAEMAVAIAKGNSKLLTEEVQLAPQKGYGEVSWKTPLQKNAFEVPIQDKVALLLEVNSEAMKGGAKYVNSNIFVVNEQKYFASTDGSYIDQDIHRIWPNFTVTKVGTSGGGFQTRNALSAPMGMGFEYLEPKEEEKIKGGPVTLYKKRYDMLEDVREATVHVEEKLKAKPLQPGKYDLILDPSHLFLTIHESVGHSTELDRVLGYEANYAGTSFLTLDKWESKKFNFGSKQVNVFADKTEQGSLGAVGYDDEGVKCGSWDIIKDGILVNYQSTRDQAHILGLKSIQGCSYADGWENIQFQRMPNVSLAPGKEALSAADMVKNVEKGIYMFGRNSYSIDQQRYNFQFSAQLAYEIKEGKIVGMLKDAAYQSNTQEFWNSCVQCCGQNDFRLGGTFSDGKGQPSQASAVSHGSATTRFNGVNVINTGKRLG